MIKFVSTGSYNKDLSTMTGSVVSSIILEKVTTWWYSNGKKEFILFPKPTDHIKYSNGRSWKETAGLTVEDLKYGLSFVGSRITERTARDTILMDGRPDFDTSGRLINSNHLILYSTKDRVTYFELNERLAELAIKVYLSGEWKNYIAPEPIEKSEDSRPLSLKEIEEISSFSGFQIPGAKENA